METFINNLLAVFGLISPTYGVWPIREDKNQSNKPIYVMRADSRPHFCFVYLNFKETKRRQNVDKNLLIFKFPYFHVPASLVFIWCLFGVYFGVLVFILGETPCKVKVLQTLIPWAFTAFCETSKSGIN